MNFPFPLSLEFQLDSNKDLFHLSTGYFSFTLDDNEAEIVKLSFKRKCFKQNIFPFAASVRVVLHRQTIEFRDLKDNICALKSQSRVNNFFAPWNVCKFSLFRWTVQLWYFVMQICNPRMCACAIITNELLVASSNHFLNFDFAIKIPPSPR